MPANVRAYRMKYFVEEVRKRAGEKGVRELEEEYGSLDFSAKRIYSEEENIALIKAIAKVLFGVVDRNSLYEVGGILAQRETESMIMKIGFRTISAKNLFRGMLFNPAVLKMIEMAIPKFAPSLKVSVTNPDLQTLVVTFFDTKMPAAVYEGEWYQLFTYLCGSVAVSSKKLSDNNFSIIIKSDRFAQISQHVSQ